MTLPLPSRATSAPSKATPSAQTHEKRLVSWHTRGKKHSTLSLLLASMSQWIFYKLSPEVHKHWAREQEKLSERQRRESRAGSWGSLFGVLTRWFSCIMHAWTPAGAEPTGRWQHLLHSSCKQGCVTQCFSAFRADPGFHLPYFMITINAWIAYIKCGVETRASASISGRFLLEGPSVSPGEGQNSHCPLQSVK